MSTLRSLATALLLVGIGCTESAGPPGHSRAANRAPASQGSSRLGVPAALSHSLVDLEPGTQIVGSYPENLTAVGDRIYFTATTPGSGQQLWMSDGSAEGTRMVVLLNQNATAYPAFRGLTPYKGSLLFVAPGAHRTTLYRTDGDVESTQVVAPSEAFEPLGSIAQLGDTLVVAAMDNDYGAELWKSDGTSAGTTLLKDVMPGLNGSYPDQLTVVGNTLFFVAYDQTGRTLFRTDGTAAGTARVDGAVERPNAPQELTAGGARVFFAATSTSGTEPWVSDGTATGTLRLADLVSGPSSSNPHAFTPALNLTFFQASTDQQANALFRTDGTISGTRPLPGPDPLHLFARGAQVYFDGSRGPGVVGRDLWVTDGSDAGTVQIVDLTDSYFGGLTWPVSLGNSFYFGNDQGPGYPLGPELWISDGTAAGTHILVDSIPGPSGTSPTHLAVAGNRIFFSGGDPDVTGAELWTSDGTPSGTHLVRDIATLGAGSDPSTPVIMGGSLYFAASTVATGRKVWRTDGTDGGASLLSDLGLGVADVVPDQLTVSGHRLFFTAQTGANQALQLWASDGTSTGTRAVHDFAPYSNYSRFPMVPWKGGLFFAGYDPKLGIEPWFSDGTAGGTAMVKDVNVGSDSSLPNTMVVFGDAVYFMAFDGTRSVLWRTDGTEAGTLPAITFFTPADTIPNGWMPVVMDGALYFITTRTLYRSDGTDVGTVPIAPTTAGAPGINPRLTVVGHRLFFKFASADGLELWVSDGTPSGTTQVVDLTPGLDGTSIGALTAVKDRLFFERLEFAYIQGYPDAFGSIWVTDGTAAGTTKLKDLSFRTFPSQVGSDTEYLSMLALEPEDRVIFLASRQFEGEEPWVSDGTPAGTRPLVEIARGPASSQPDAPVRFGNSVVLPADDGQIGKELWVVDISVATDNIPPSLQCPADMTVTAASAGATTATVIYPAPTASDAVTDVEVRTNPASGSAFPLGTTQVQVTAQDAFANRSVCSFRVTVNPYAAPDAGVPGGTPHNGGCSAAGGLELTPSALLGVLLLGGAGARRRTGRETRTPCQ